MKNTQKALLIVVLAASTLTLQAGGMSFSEFDADNNGTVSEQEFYNAKNKNIAAKVKEGRKMQGLANAPTFASIDANHDGQLTADEMTAMQQGHDRQGDKAMVRPPKPVFADFDSNSNGSLTEQEYNDARNKRIADRAKEGRKMRGLANLASFADIDANADGTVSQDEFTTFLAEHEKQAH